MKILPQYQLGNESKSFSIVEISLREAIESPTENVEDGKEVSIFVFIILGIGFLLVY